MAFPPCFYGYKMISANLYIQKIYRAVQIIYRDKIWINFTNIKRKDVEF